MRGAKDLSALRISFCRFVTPANAAPTLFSSRDHKPVSAPVPVAEGWACLPSLTFPRPQLRVLDHVVNEFIWDPAQGAPTPGSQPKVPQGIQMAGNTSAEPQAYAETLVKVVRSHDFLPGCRSDIKKAFSFFIMLPLLRSGNIKSKIFF
ncbi:hypothetical protein [uncultured Roseibium sp.]|uniref:hypothetical protein n=1 Tax=uncultured Roseibium sp. TaxID=1936171 RepID=UPI002599C172|nr:hypothetical protein [uncultured Roseibium sp.]